MCYGCYRKYGEPSIVNERTIQAAKLIDRLYNDLCCLSGGNLHIVTDDWNIEDHNLEFCRKEVNNGGWTDERGDKYNDDPEQLKLEAEILDLLEPMSVDERASALALECGFITAVQPS